MTPQPFRRGDTRLAVSFGLMFEGGGQPISDAGGKGTTPVIHHGPPTESGLPGPTLRGETT